MRLPLLTALVAAAVSIPLAPTAARAADPIVGTDHVIPSLASANGPSATLTTDPSGDVGWEVDSAESGNGVWLQPSGGAAAQQPDVPALGYLPENPAVYAPALSGRWAAQATASQSSIPTQVHVTHLTDGSTRDVTLTSTQRWIGVTAAGDVLVDQDSSVSNGNGHEQDVTLLRADGGTTTLVRTLYGASGVVTDGNDLVVQGNDPTSGSWTVWHVQLGSTPVIKAVATPPSQVGTFITPTVYGWSDGTTLRWYARGSTTSPSTLTLLSNMRGAITDGTTTWWNDGATTFRAPNSSLGTSTSIPGLLKSSLQLTSDGIALLDLGGDRHLRIEVWHGDGSVTTVADLGIRPQVLTNLAVDGDQLLRIGEDGLTSTPLSAGAAAGPASVIDTNASPTGELLAAGGWSAWQDPDGSIRLRDPSGAIVRQTDPGSGSTIFDLTPTTFVFRYTTGSTAHIVRRLLSTGAELEIHPGYSGFLGRGGVFWEELSSTAPGLHLGRFDELTASLTILDVPAAVCGDANAHILTAFRDWVAVGCSTGAVLIDTDTMAGHPWTGGLLGDGVIFGSSSDCAVSTLDVRHGASSPTCAVPGSDENDPYANSFAMDWTGGASVAWQRGQRYDTHVATVLGPDVTLGAVTAPATAAQGAGWTLNASLSGPSAWSLTVQPAHRVPSTTTGSASTGTLTATVDTSTATVGDTWTWSLRAVGEDTARGTVTASGSFTITAAPPAPVVTATPPRVSTALGGTKKIKGVATVGHTKKLTDKVAVGSGAGCTQLQAQRQVGHTWRTAYTSKCLRPGATTKLAFTLRAKGTYRLLVLWKPPTGAERTLATTKLRVV